MKSTNEIIADYKAREIVRRGNEALKKAKKSNGYDRAVSILRDPKRTEHNRVHAMGDIALTLLADTSLHHNHSEALREIKQMLWDMHLMKCDLNKLERGLWVDEHYMEEYREMKREWENQ